MGLLEREQCTDIENQKLDEYFEPIKDYQSLKHFFFKQLHDLLKVAIINSGYSTEQPLDELLRKLDKFDLFLYIWKDAYLKEYVFDAEDQREALIKTYNYTHQIFSTQEALDEYINSHDENCKREHAKHSNDYSNLIPNR